MLGNGGSSSLGRTQRKAAERVCVAFFSEEPVASVFGASTPLLLLLRAFPEEVGLLLNVPASTATRVPGEEVSGIAVETRPGYGSSFLGFATRLPWMWRSMRRSIRRTVSGADAVVSQFPSPLLPFVLRAARQAGTPHILHVVGDIREAVRSGEKYRRGLPKAIARMGAAAMHRLAVRSARDGLVIAASGALAEQFAPVAGRSVAVAPTSISEDDLHDREDTCRGEKVRLLFVGRLVPLKGLGYLLEAVRRLTDDGWPVELELVGDGPQRKGLERRASDLGLRDCVRFEGAVPFGPVLTSKYRCADLFVLPSLSEGTPRVLWEAWAAGLPVVATRVGGIGEVVRNEESGLLVEPGDSGEIARAVERLIEGEELRRRLIRGGLAMAREHTVTRQAAAFWEEIRALLERERQ